MDAHDSNINSIVEWKWPFNAVLLSSDALISVEHDNGDERSCASIYLQPRAEIRASSSGGPARGGVSRLHPTIPTRNSHEQHSNAPSLSDIQNGETRKHGPLCCPREGPAPAKKSLSFNSSVETSLFRWQTGIASTILSNASKLLLLLRRSWLPKGENSAARAQPAKSTLWRRQVT